MRYTSPHPKDMRENVIAAHARAARAVRAHPPAAPVGLEPDPEGDAPHLQPRALPEARRDDSRARPRLRDHHRHHRRLPGRDRGGIRARRSRSSSEVGYDAAFTFIFSPRRGDRGRDPRRSRFRTRSSASAWSGWSSSSSGERCERSPAVRRDDAGGAGGGPEPHRRRAAARPHPAQQDGQLRRHRARPGIWSRSRSRARPPRRSPARRPCSPRCLSPAIVESSRSSGRPRVGKTEVAVELAELLRARGEDPVAVSATRSRSTRARDRSAAKPTPDELRASSTGWSSFVPIDERVQRPGASPTRAHAEIDALLAEGRRPIVVGGTGLYLRAALTELELRPAGPRRCARRSSASSPSGGRRRCTRGCAPEIAAGVHPNDRKRIVRCTELERMGIGPYASSRAAVVERAAAPGAALRDRDGPRGARGADRRARRRMVAPEPQRGGARRRSSGARRGPRARRSGSRSSRSAGDVEARPGAARAPPSPTSRQLTWMRKMAGVEMIDRTAAPTPRSQPSSSRCSDRLAAPRCGSRSGRRSATTTSSSSGTRCRSS